jgi:transposase
MRGSRALPRRKVIMFSIGLQVVVPEPHLPGEHPQLAQGAPVGRECAKSLAGLEMEISRSTAVMGQSHQSPLPARFPWDTRWTPSSHLRGI